MMLWCRVFQSRARKSIGIKLAESVCIAGFSSKSTRSICCTTSRTANPQRIHHKSTTNWTRRVWVVDPIQQVVQQIDKKSTTNPQLLFYNLYNKSTTNRTIGVWAFHCKCSIEDWWIDRLILGLHVSSGAYERSMSKLFILNQSVVYGRHV
jgi:hypothetical protein